MATLASSGSLTATNPTSDVEPESCDLSEFDDNTVFVIDTIGMGGFVHDSSNSTSTFLPDSVALLELGGISIFAHTLSQLDGARRIVVLCREEKTQSHHLQESKSQTPAPLSRFRLESLVKDIDLNIDLTFVETTSSTKDMSNRDAFYQTFNALSPFLKDDLNVVVVPLNCIFSTPILYRCAQHGVNLSILDSPSTNHRSRSSSISEPSAMAVVLEQDLEGMVGMPESWLKASYKPLDNSDGKGKVVATGSSLTSYGAIFTGLYVMTPRMITSTAIKVLSDPKLRQHFFKAHTF